MILLKIMFTNTNTLKLMNLRISQPYPFCGGLFDCLDELNGNKSKYLDGFSENIENKLCIPNELFWGHEVKSTYPVFVDTKNEKKKFQDY